MTSHDFGRATALWPTILDKSGDVVSISVLAHVARADQKADFNACESRAGNGYLTFACLVDEAGIDEVRGFLSIPRVQD